MIQKMKTENQVRAEVERLKKRREDFTHDIYVPLRVKTLTISRIDLKLDALYWVLGERADKETEEGIAKEKW